MDSPKINARYIYAAKHAIAGAPMPSEDPLVKDRFFRAAVKSAAANGLGDDPYFKGSQKKLFTFLRNNWGGEYGVRWWAAEEFGVVFEYGHGLKGIRRAGKKGAEATALWQAKCIQEQTKVHNHLAGASRLMGAKAPSIQMLLLQ